MRSWIWLLGACTPGDDPPTSTSDPTGSETATTADTGSPASPSPRFASPAEAVDQDADPTRLHVQLVATPHRWPAGATEVDGYAYNGQVPGPTLRLQRGDTLVVDLINHTDLDTSIHWHGLSVPFAMDGAGWRVAPVPPGGTFRYELTAEQAGTFWYHPHFDTERSVDLGLYGVVVVEDPADPPVDDEIVLVLDSVGEADGSPDTQGIEPSPQQWLVNGMMQPTWAPASGARVRARIVNVSNLGYLALDQVVVVAGDQGRLPASRSSVVLPPGDRADLLWSVGPEPGSLATTPWSMIGPGPGDLVPLLQVQPVGSAAAPDASWPAFEAVPTPDPGRTDLRYTFTGSPGAGWEINGGTFPDIEPDVVALGAEVVLEIRNLSPVHHPFHLHGMVFEVLAIDGVAPARRQIEDTLDIGIRQTVRLRIEANNPGDWMSHCHILPHAEQGMMTVLSVLAP